MSDLDNILSTLFQVKKDSLKSNANEFSTLLSTYQARLDATNDVSEKLQIVTEACKSMPNWGYGNLYSKLRKDFVDETVSRSVIAKYSFGDYANLYAREQYDTMYDALIKEQERYKIANLLFKIVEEQLELKEPASSKSSAQSTFASKPSTSVKSNAQPRQVMFDQIAQFESIAFEKDNIDENEVTAYLENLFSKCEDDKLAKFRKVIQDKGKSLLDFKELEDFDNNTRAEAIKNAIKAYMKEGIASNEDNKILKQLLENKSALDEVCNIIFTRISKLNTFSWQSEGITCSLVRQLNGHYRIMMRPDLLDGILLTYIGMEWCNALLEATTELYESSSWKSPRVDMSYDQRTFRKIFFDEWLHNNTSKELTSNVENSDSIAYQRRNNQTNYFMTQLKHISSNQSTGYDDDADDNSTAAYIDPRELKNEILLTLISEFQLSKTLKRGQGAIRTDYNWFGPSLSHTTIRAVLKFFGATDVWLDFFDSFLKAPLIIEYPHVTEEDGVVTTETIRKPVRVRQRGTPMGFHLSSFLGEAILFCQDYNVNQTSDGRFLYRMHDDFWFWDSDRGVCEKTWEAMVQLSKVFGLKFNDEKTGSVWVEADGESKTVKLPPGKIAWGLLNLESDGKFRIDQSAVDNHIAELKYQLSLSPSLISWVRSYNGYVGRYLINNFGNPSYAMGYGHVEDIIKTLDRVNKELLPEFNGSVTLFLRNELEKRFGSGPESGSNLRGTDISVVADIPEGWFYLPMAWGGLGLENPQILFASILAHRKDQDEIRPAYFFDKCLDDSRRIYDQLQESWSRRASSLERDELEVYEQFRGKAYTSGDDWFPTYEEYLYNHLAPEFLFTNWGLEYSILLSGDNLSSFTHRTLYPEIPDISTKLGHISNLLLKVYIGNKHRITADDKYGCYADVIALVFGPDIIKKWGSARVVWHEALPSAIIDLWQKEKNTWV